MAFAPVDEYFSKIKADLDIKVKSGFDLPAEVLEKSMINPRPDRTPSPEMIN